MRLPNGERAVVDINKLRGYCLSATHPHGRHKARVFASALGITPGDAEVFVNRFSGAALEREAVPGASDAFGPRYSIDVPVVGPKGGAIVRSCWLVRRDDGVPRLTTCYVL